MHLPGNEAASIHDYSDHSKHGRVFSHAQRQIDRSKLPPDEARGLDSGSIPPRSELEELIANIWRDVLQIEIVSVHDNFFALGGHSLLAIQIVSKLREVFNKEVPLRILFDAPTIAELGQVLETIIPNGHALSCRRSSGRRATGHCHCQ